MLKTEINVVIALIVYETSVLVGWRQEHQHQGNKNEFPGGKVERGEELVSACQREILEEVGVKLQEFKKVDYIHHEYDDVIVQLHVYLSHLSTSQMNQIKTPWFWVKCNEVQHLNFPKANDVILKRLTDGAYFR